MDERVALAVVILFVLSACAGGTLQLPTTATTPQTSQPCLIWSYTHQPTSQKLDFYLPPQRKGLAPW
jgi:hypothetical protein